MKTVPNNVINIDNFAAQKPESKSNIQAIIKFLVREVNRNKLNYHQLKYIFRVVRSRCDIQTDTKPKKLIELPTEAELALFFNAITNPIHKLLFDVLIGSGLRVGELCSLEVKRIDFQANQIFVFQGKGKKDRIVLFGNHLKEKLQIYLQGKQNKWLFESTRNTRFTTRRIEQICSKYKTASGITKSFTPHTCRHIWNTRLAMKGLGKEKRALLAGHSNDKTQDIYTHLSIGGFQSEIIKMLDDV